MSKAAAIRFVSESRKAHGVHETISKTQRLVLCTVKRVRQSEYYEAHNAGFRPEYQFDLTAAEDYHDEDTLIYEGKEYGIIRTYEKSAGGLEIIAGRSDRNEPEDNTDDTDDSDGGQDPGDD